jgi:hypothetical protein
MATPEEINAYVRQWTTGVIVKTWQPEQSRMVEEALREGIENIQTVRRGPEPYLPR